MNGFYIFPVDIWKLLINDYIDDFKTLQNLSTMNKRMRGFFREYQLKMRNVYFFREEKRIYDIDFKKLDVSSNILQELQTYYNCIPSKFIYVLYKHENILVNIDINLKSYLDDMSYKDVELVKSQTGWTWGKALLRLQDEEGDLIFAITHDE